MAFSTRRHFDQKLTANCRFCGMPDSLEHRFCHCASFSEGRMSTGFQQRLDSGSLVSAQRLHAWAQHAPSISSVQQHLVSISDPDCLSHDLGGFDVFTDGSACIRNSRLCV